MVEFVFVSIPLIMLVFAIIWFGLALNIKQDLTRAAAEGARAGAVALPNQEERHLIALSATHNAVSGFLNGGCDREDVDCEVAPIAPCATFGDQGTGDCIKVTVNYSGGLAGNSIPFVGQVIPSTLSAGSVVRVNDVVPSNNPNDTP